jgi:hypothetical protein
MTKTNESGTFLTTDLEKMINRLAGVILSKVVTDARSDISEIHILANYQRSPKQIVRDVQSLAATSFDMNLEHRIISVAQIADDSMLEIGIRLKIKDFDVSWAGNKVTMSVTLAGIDRVAKGTATGMNTAPSRNLAAARACIAALHEFLTLESTFDVIDIQKLRIAGVDSYSVAVSYNDKGEDQILLGASIVRDGDYNAIIAATLDAVNRLVNRLMNAGQPG